MEKKKKSDKITVASPIPLNIQKKNIKSGLYHLNCHRNTYLIFVSNLPELSAWKPAWRNPTKGIYRHQKWKDKDVKKA